MQKINLFNRKISSHYNISTKKSVIIIVRT